MNGLDVALLASIVAFVRTQFGLTGRSVVIVAILLGTIFWFQADLAALSPLLGKGLEYLKFILAAPGLFDLTTGIGFSVGKKVKAFSVSKG